MPEISDKELPQSVRPYWLKALSAVDVKNHAYAVSLSQAILKDNPGFLVGRELLRKCEGFLTGGSGMKLQGAAKKDPASAVPLIEKVLEKDPFNDALNDLLHDCLLKMELFDSAAFALETVRKSHPENTKSMHKLALFYLERGRADAAVDLYNDILKAESTDAKAIKGSKDCAAQHSMQRHNWSEHSSLRDLMKDQSEFQELEAASRAGMTKDQMYEKRDRLIAHDNEDPNNLGNGDAALKTKGLQMSDQFIAQQIATFSAAVEADPDNAKQRVDENPTDPQMRFELGSALYNAGDHSAAIPHLQQAKSNPHIRNTVILLLGRTFKAKAMLDLSLKQLSDALADLHGMDNIKKEVLYDKASFTRNG